MAINFVGLAGIGVFYVVILALGIWASRKRGSSESEEEVMLAGRNIGLFVGICTMTATWVGGGYINGTAEVSFAKGLVWCQAPLGEAFALFIGGLFFAKKMRKKGYVTMLDPFQDAFGNRMGGLLFIPALFGDVIWSAAILSALGTTLSIILDLDANISVIVSAFIAVFYTLIGGLYSVCYTDIIQLFCIIGGLWLSIPFAMSNDAVKSLSLDNVDWFGTVTTTHTALYIDSALTLMLGGVPWQCYFQRVLAAKTAQRAQTLSYIAGVFTILMSIPSIIIGGVAKATVWNETEYAGEIPFPEDKQQLVLPIVLQYLTPQAVSFFGLGAISAAVMSSADSAVLSSSTMFSRNVYRLIFRPNASEKEIIWVMRAAIFVVGGLATAMALTVKSIYGLWFLCSDLVYVMLFPQLVSVVYFRDFSNTYGSACAYLVGMFLRLASGEEMLQLKPWIRYPWYTEQDGQLFPFRTFGMLASLITLLAVSAATKWVFVTAKLNPKLDAFECFPDVSQNETLADSRSRTDKRTSLKGRINPALDLNDHADQSEHPDPDSDYIRSRKLETNQYHNGTHEATTAL